MVAWCAGRVVCGGAICVATTHPVRAAIFSWWGAVVIGGDTIFALHWYDITYRRDNVGDLRRICVGPQPHAFAETGKQGDIGRARSVSVGASSDLFRPDPHHTRVHTASPELCFDSVLGRDVYFFRHQIAARGNVVNRKIRGLFYLSRSRSKVDSLDLLTLLIAAQIVLFKSSRNDSHVEVRA